MTPEQFDAMWVSMANATYDKHPDTDLFDWCVREAKGLIVHPSCDPSDPHSGRIEWIA